MSARKHTTLQVGSKKVEVSSLDKVFYPKTGFTKGEVIDFYIKIAPVLLPHLKGRAITMKRYPDGVEGMFFYEKQKPSHAPSWIKTTTVEKTDGEINYCLVNDLPTLVWMANIANLELHPFTHLAKAPATPTSLVFDLDPGPPANVLDCCEVAVRLRDIFKKLGLESFIKTSGSKGMQMVVPLNTPGRYERTKAFAHTLAEALAHAWPECVVSDMKKSLREGKVLIDWSQNDDKKTTVSVYSLRAKDEPTVSTPVEWKEVEKARKTKNAGLLKFTAAEVIKRVSKKGDLFEEVLTMKQKLPDIRQLGRISD